ncbi:MAG: cytochrome P450 [Gammaproteobacteria bacterium]
MKKTLKDLPGPAGLPLLGNLHQLDLPQLHQQLERWAHEFGPVYRFRIGPRERVCISDNDLINTMLRERPERYRRPRTNEAIVAEMGINGVFSQDGDAWRRQRGIIAQALNPAHLAQFYPTLRLTTERLLGRWIRAAESGETVDLCRDLMRYTVDVTAHLAFGEDVNTLETDGPVVQQHLDKVFPTLFKRILAPFPLWRYWRTQADRELETALQEIRQTVLGLIEKCRERMQADPERYAQPANFLEAIIAAQAAEGTEFTDDEIYANVVTLLLAGEDTTANTTAWAVKFLIDHPALAAELRAEADATLGEERVPTQLAQVRTLDRTEAFAMETMRFKPVAPLLALEPKEDVDLLGYRIPAGTTVLTLFRVNALNERYFGDAARFDPSRWLAAETAANRAHEPRAFLPFGSGPRFCPGRGLALLEIKAVLAMICRNFDVALAEPDGEICERLSFTMLPEHLDVRFALRAADG